MLRKVTAAAIGGSATRVWRRQRVSLARTMSSSASPAAETLMLNNEGDGVYRLTLNNPRAKNALSLEQLERIEGALGEVAALPRAECRVLLLDAVGNCFSSGHDLKEITSTIELRQSGKDVEAMAFYQALFKKCSEVMVQLRALPQPSICAVDGIATAAGCQLVATCDLAVASSRSRFCLPGVNIGQFWVGAFVCPLLCRLVLCRGLSLSLLLFSRLLLSRLHSSRLLIPPLLCPPPLSTAFCSTLFVQTLLGRAHSHHCRSLPLAHSPSLPCAQYAGLFCSTPAVAVARAVGRKRAMEMLLTGEFFDAHAAERFGLVNRVVDVSEEDLSPGEDKQFKPSQRLADSGLELARLVASKSWDAMELGLPAFDRQMECGSDLVGAYEAAGEAMASNMLKPDAEEGIKAIMSRREPKWDR